MTLPTAQITPSKGYSAKATSTSATKRIIPITDSGWDFPAIAQSRVTKFITTVRRGSQWKTASISTYAATILRITATPFYCGRNGCQTASRMRPRMIPAAIGRSKTIPLSAIRRLSVLRQTRITVSGPSGRMAPGGYPPLYLASISSGTTISNKMRRSLTWSGQRGLRLKRI